MAPLAPASAVDASSSGQIGRATRQASWLILAAIVALALAGSIYWVQVNVVLVGRDSAGHLEQSVLVGRALAEPWPQGLFKAITLDDYRPPALYLLTQLSYALFGVTLDAASWTNVALLALILLLTYLLARALLPERWALFATAITALLPMLAAMTRLYYMENLLTAALLLNTLALLRADGFRRRGWTLVWGLSLGLALLEKWTAPVYLLAPTLYVLWRTGFFAHARSDLRAEGLRPLALLGSAALAVALALAWYWPNRTLVAAMEMPLGGWLPVLWALLWTPLLYGLATSRTSAGHLATATLLALGIASLWYLPRIDFLTRLGDVAFGTDRGTQEAWSLLRLEGYTRYPRFWLTHHMGLLATLLILPPALWGWWRLHKQAGAPRLAMAVYVWMVASGWLLLTLLAQANPRNLVPLLPATAILLTEGLRALPGAGLRSALAALWIAVLGFQWSLYTFDALAPFAVRTQALWVHGDYMAWPASGPSDPGYWIHPEVLALVNRAEGDPVTLGMLIDTWEIHRGAFRYLITRDRLNVEIMPLTESDSPGWSDLLSNEYVLLKDGDNSAVKPPGQALLARIAAGDPLFDRLYAPQHKWALPNGDTATLYRRSLGPPRPQDYPVVLIETSAIADAANELWSPGATLYITDPDTAAWVGIHDLKADRMILPDANVPVLEALEGVKGTILAVSRYRTPEVQEALRATALVVKELGDGEFHLTVAGRPSRALEPLPPQSGWQQVTIEGLESYAEVAPGEVLPLALALEGRTDGSLKLSVRLIDGGGQPVAQQDVAAAPQVSLGLLVPPRAAPGPYTVGAVLYDPATLAPLPDLSGREMAPVAAVIVRPAP